MGPQQVAAMAIALSPVASESAGAMVDSEIQVSFDETWCEGQWMLNWNEKYSLQVPVLLYFALRQCNKESLFDGNQATVEGQKFIERIEILWTSFGSQDTPYCYFS